jgi:hypothetical protein
MSHPQAATIEEFDDDTDVRGPAHRRQRTLLRAH